MVESKTEESLLLKRAKEESIKQELAKRGLEYIGMKQKEGTDWKPKPHFRYKPVSRSKYTPHMGGGQYKESKQCH